MFQQKDTINFYLCRNRFASLSQKLRSAWPSGRSGAILGCHDLYLAVLNLICCLVIICLNYSCAVDVESRDLSK